MSWRRECRAHVLSALTLGRSSLTFFFRTLLSIHEFMLKAAQTKWISRLVAKASIQDALVQFDQQLRDAAVSFQVRWLTRY